RSRKISDRHNLKVTPLEQPAYRTSREALDMIGRKGRRQVRDPILSTQLKIKVRGMVEDTSFVGYIQPHQPSLLKYAVDFHQHSCWVVEMLQNPVHGHNIERSSGE